MSGPSIETMSGNVLRRAGNKRPRPASMEVVTEKPTQTVRTITRLAPKKRKSVYAGVYKFKRTYNFGTVSSDGINFYGNAFNFSMNDMPGYTELTGLFDFYKLTGVKFRFIPYYQDMSNSVGSTNNSRNPPIFYAIDRSDSTSPATVDELLEYNDHKISNVWKGFQCWIPNPKFADATSAMRGGFVATSNPSLNWYGLKVAIPPTGVANSWYVVMTYYVSCKDPK